MSMSVPQWWREAPGSADQRRMAKTSSRSLSVVMSMGTRVAVEDGLQAAGLAVPDGELLVEAAEGALDPDVEALSARRRAQLLEGLDHVAVDRGAQPFGVGGRAQLFLGLSGQYGCSGRIHGDIGYGPEGRKG